MSNEFKLKQCWQGKGHAGQWCGPLFDCWLDPRDRKERDADFEARKAIAAAGERLSASQPPALGGERKIKTYECELPVLPEALTSEAFHMVKLDDHCAHLAPLQAEIERLESESEENHKEREVIFGNYDQIKAELGKTELNLNIRIEQADEFGIIILEQEEEIDQLKARCDELEGLLARIRGKRATCLSSYWFDEIDDALSKPAGSDQ